MKRARRSVAASSDRLRQGRLSVYSRAGGGVEVREVRGSGWKTRCSSGTRKWWLAPLLVILPAVGALLVFSSCARRFVSLMWRRRERQAIPGGDRLTLLRITHYASRFTLIHPAAALLAKNIAFTRGLL